MSEASNKRPEMKILVPAAVSVFLIIATSLIFPESFQSTVKMLYGNFTKHFGTYFLLFTSFLIVLCLYFMFGRHGRIKFGAPDEKPEFSNVSWIAMMFCSGVAGAVMFWSIVEPLYNLLWPPQYAEPGSIQALEWSLAYVLFHWGPITWPWYVIPALPICYMYYNRGKHVIRISAAAEPVLGEKRVNSSVGFAMEVFVIVGLLFSNAAVMGISLPIVNHALGSLFGFEPTFGVEFGVLCASAVIFCTSVWLGLEKGIARLSQLNVIISLSMVGVALVFGPTTFIVDNFTNSLGVMIQNMPKMLFWTEPYTANNFPQDWTIFYALFMASYGPFMGLFIARISRGRTVRQVVGMGILGGCAGAFMIHGTFGSWSIYTEINDIVNATEILKASGGPAAMVAVLNALPMGKIVLVGYCLFSTIFLATSVDSGAYVISNAVSKRLNLGEEPARGHRFFWALLQAGMAVVVITMGGLGATKVFSNFAGALMIIPICFLIASWFKMLKEDYPAE